MQRVHRQKVTVLPMVPVSSGKCFRLAVLLGDLLVEVWFAAVVLNAPSSIDSCFFAAAFNGHVNCFAGHLNRDWIIQMRISNTGWRHELRFMNSIRLHPQPVL